MITLAATDARFWRLSGVPAYIYGCSPDVMGTYDESVGLEEFLNVVRVHALSAAAYLGRASESDPHDPLEKELLARLDASRDRSIAFLRDLLRVPSPNPPGDTRAAAAFLQNALREAGCIRRHLAAPGDAEHRAGFRAASAGRHLVLNGHIDVFPVAEHEWTRTRGAARSSTAASTVAAPAT